MLTLTNICKSYAVGEQSLTVLNNINLSIQSGEYIAITGTSGSGKTTLMNILGCLDTPSSGHYFIEQNDVSLLADKQLSNIRNQLMGFIFQSFHLLNKKTAIDNVLLPKTFSYFNRKDELQKATELLSAVGLAERLQHKPNELSGGQSQRVAIARALLNQPKILFADEPTGNLDSTTTEEIMALFEQLNDQGQTLVIVTHEPDIALRAKRCITMKDGVIIGDKMKSNNDEQ